MPKGKEGKLALEVSNAPHNDTAAELANLPYHKKSKAPIFRK